MTGLFFQEKELVLKHGMLLWDVVIINCIGDDDDDDDSIDDDDNVRIPQIPFFSPMK